MGSLTKLETAIDGVLGDKAPVKLPPNARKGLAGALWWLAAVFGVLELWSAYSLWDLGHKTDQIVDYVNNLAGYYGAPVANHLGVSFYVSLLAMAGVAALLLLAVPGLKAMKKSGWDLLFYGVLIEAAVAIARLFSNVGGGFGNFLGAAIGTILGAYFLFQVRSYFVGAKKVANPEKK